MRLSSDLATDFSEQTRNRGAGYYASGSVRIVNGSEAEVEARVRGAREYYVDLVCEDDSLNLSCDCPYFDSTGPCKHLWATILAAEAKGLLSAASNLDRGSVVYDYSDYEEVEEREPSGDDTALSSDRSYKPAGPVPVPKLQPKPAGWREHLKEVADTVPVTREIWPADREFVYVVDVQASVTRGLIVKLMTREPKKSGGWKAPQPPRMMRSAVSLLPDPRDRHILGMITGVASHDQWAGLNYYDPIHPSYRLQHPLAEAVMHDAAETGRCMLQLDVYGQIISCGLG